MSEIPCNNKQLLGEAEYDTKNYADRGGSYPEKPKAEADNTGVITFRVEVYLAEC